MKDGFDVVKEVISLINVPAVTSQISGKIWPHMMPGGLKTVNIVVGVMLVNNEFIQYSPVNIRVHAPNVEITQANGTIYRGPDLVTLNKIVKIISPLVDTQWKFDFWTEIVGAGTIFQDSDGSWFSLIKVDWRHLQSNYKNI